jgi:hypothetical protein
MKCVESRRRNRKGRWGLKPPSRKVTGELLEQMHCVLHVKDGKPLTAHGAELLGVPWTRRK